MKYIFLSLFIFGCSSSVNNFIVGNCYTPDQNSGFSHRYVFKFKGIKDRNEYWSLVQGNTTYLHSIEEAMKDLKYKGAIQVTCPK